MPFWIVHCTSKDFARILVNLCLTFDVPTFVARANFGPADHSRAQGPVESAERMAPRDVGKTLFELLVGRKPRAALDSLVPLLDDVKQPGNFDNIVKQRKLNYSKVHQGFETKSHRASSLARALDSLAPLLRNAKQQDNFDNFVKQKKGKLSRRPSRF